MTMVSGARLGPYEIVAPIGAGGMGRQVAVKILPETRADDGGRHSCSNIRG